LTELSNVVAYLCRGFAPPKLRKQCHPERSERPFATPDQRSLAALGMTPDL
jgi:hypothetical protein